MQSLASLSSLAALGWKKSAKSTFRFTLSAIIGAVPITFTTSRAGSVIDWGDGTATTLVSGTNSLSHTYSGYSTANVSISNAQYITQIAYTASTASIVCTTTALPRNINIIYIGGANVFSGDAGGLPSGLTEATFGGSNIISGDVGRMPAGLTLANFGGNNVLNAYSSRTWSSTMRKVIINPTAPGGLSSAQIDQLLIDLAAYVTTWTAERQITLTGANAARTAASNAAVTTLQGRSVTVTTN